MVMNVNYYVPMVATIIYIVLLFVTAFNRPWSRQHRYFFYYLVSAVLWSLTDALMRSPFFDQIDLLLFRLAAICTILWALQLFLFSRAFLHLPGGFGAKFGYSALAVFCVLCAIGVAPPSVSVGVGVVAPVYGWWLVFYFGPLVGLIVVGVYSLTKRMRAISDPEERNKISYLIMAVYLLMIFGFISVTPFAHGLPLSHVGGILSAVVLALAVVQHELISLDLVMRRALGWFSLFILSVMVFEALLFGGHYLFGFNLSQPNIVFVTIATIIVMAFLSWIRPRFLKKIDQLFASKTYEHRQELLDYVAQEIRGVSSLEDLGIGLLLPLRNALQSQLVLMLLPEKDGGDFTTQLTDPPGINSPLRIRNDSPVIELLNKQYLVKKDLEIRPELRGVWSSERAKLNAAGVEMLFPLMNRGNLIGILALGRKARLHYSVDDINLVQSIASAVAITLEKEHYQGELREREKELSVINELTRVITSSLDIQNVYDKFIQGLKGVVDIDFAAIGTVENDKLCFSALYNKEKLPWKVGSSIDLRGSGLEWLVLNKKTLINPDISISASESGLGKSILDLGVKSLISLPLIIKDEVIGILTLASCKPNTYSLPNRIRLLEQLASQVSTSLVNAQLYNSAEKRARVDELTGLSNRRHFDEVLENEVQRHLRYGSTVSLLFIDVDNFKDYNDLLGHPAGDKLLRKLAQLIRSGSREVDLSFRYGGDEFAVILPNTASENALAVAQRIRQSVEQEMQTSPIPVTLSLGIASWPNDGIKAQDLISASDQSLYHAKLTGKNRVCTADQMLPNEKEVNSEEESPVEKDTLNAIYALASTIEARDLYTYGHSRKVRLYAVNLAEAIKLPAQKVAIISHAALLHDIGKIGIYDNILNKPDILSKEEREIIKSHPELSRAIVAHIPNLIPCLPAILHHHERWDGAGYPYGLKGENIPLEARILSIADSFDAMTSTRPYRNPLPKEKVMEELRRGAGCQFDAKLIEAFLPLAAQILEDLTPQSQNSPVYS
jgi:diguanylate cyclase (GGDEF)-like protein